MSVGCPFCNLVGRILREGVEFSIIDSKFPVTDNGHLLIVSKRHISDFTSSIDSLEQIFEFSSMLKEAVSILRARNFNHFNMGANIGELAGQTIQHAHFHLIGRVKGDVKDPRGGIRNIIPKRGNYLK